MDDQGRVSELWRYPVSSLGGERLPTLRVDRHGALGDRLYGIVGTAAGLIASPTDAEWKTLVRIRSRLGQSGAVEIATPETDWLPAPGAEADAAISAFLGFGAALLPYEQVAREGDATTAPRYDKAPIHLLTTASLARLKAIHPNGDPDRRRFRPNILIDLAAQEGRFPETEWIGRRIAIGALQLTVAEPCKRCGFTMLAQEGFDYDPEILRSLVRSNRSNIGVYCTVDEAAEISAGDTLRFLD